MAVSYPDTPGVSRYFDISIRITHHYYEILATYITTQASFTVSLAGLYCTIKEPQPIQYFKSVFLEILNVTIRSVFTNPVTFVDYISED